MEGRALSQDELNLLLNGAGPGQEGASEPGSGPAVILRANEQKNEGGREEAGQFTRASENASRESMVVQRPDDKKITVQPVQFMPFDTGTLKKEGGLNKLELIYDVSLQITVELGRTEKTLQEILEIGPGSIVGLDKLAGEPLDILVNGKLLARGEVIVIDENYGVRIKEVVDSSERVGSLGG